MIACTNTDRPTHICPVMCAGLLTGRIRRLINRPKLILRHLVSPDDTVVDLGCGPGYFTLPLAELVGEGGRVIAVDVQEGMLQKLSTRAEGTGLEARIRPYLATPDAHVVTDPVDFVLAFWVLHEARDQRGLLQNAHDLLRRGGRLLLVEPLGEVSKGQFTAALAVAREVGLVLLQRPRVGLSRAALLERPL